MHGESGFMFLKGARRRADYAVPIQRGRTSLSILLTGGDHMEYHDGQRGTHQKQIHRQTDPAQGERDGQGPLRNEECGEVDDPPPVSRESRGRRKAGRQHHLCGLRIPGLRRRRRYRHDDRQDQGGRRQPGVLRAVHRRTREGGGLDRRTLQPSAGREMRHLHIVVHRHRAHYQGVLDKGPGAGDPRRPPVPAGVHGPERAHGPDILLREIFEDRRSADSEGRHG